MACCTSGYTRTISSYSCGCCWIKTSGSHAAATKMVSMPLEMGVVKTLAICRPMRKEKATMTGVKPPLEL